MRWAIGSGRMWTEGSLGSLWEGQVATATLWRGARKRWGTCRCVYVHQLEERPGTTDTGVACGAVSLTRGLAVLQKTRGLASPVPSTGPRVCRGDSLERSPRGAEDSRLSEEEEDEDSVASSASLPPPSTVSLPLGCGAEAENWVKTEEFTTPG